MLKSTKKFKVFAMILLTSAILLLAINPNVSSVKAATTTSVYVFTTLGGTMTGNGTALKEGGVATTYTTGDSVSFDAAASSGWNFLCFVYASTAGAFTSITNPFSLTLSESAYSIEAIYTPTHNSTSSAPSGTSTLVVFSGIGGTTEPSGGLTGPVYTNYTVGKTYSFTETPGSGQKFLCWITETVSGSSYYTQAYTTTPLSLNLTSSSVTIQAFWIPTSSTVVLPKIISEFSPVMIAVLLSALVLIAAATYVYRRRTKK